MSKNILVVDDTRANLRFLVKILTQQGYRVRPASNGRMALIAAQTELPDLILLDILMPGMDGYQVCEALKADERTSDIPIIFISALHATLDKVKAFSVGGVDYITKPFHIEEVIARVETHLSLQDMQKKTLAHNKKLQQEVTDRKIVEKSLYYHKYLLDNVSDAVISSDMNFVIKSWNNAATDMYGWQSEEVIGKLVSEIVRPTYQTVSRQKIVEAFFTNGYWKGEVIHHHQDGRAIDILASVKMLNDNAGNPIGVVSVNRDITDYKRTEIALKCSEAELQALFAAMTDLIMVLDRNGKYLKIAPTSPELLYRPSTELLGKTISKVFSPSLAEMFLTNIQQTIKSGETSTLEYNLNINGNEHWFDARISFLTEETVVFVAHDITNRKEAEQQIQAQNQFLYTILESLSSPFYVINVSDYSIEIANSAARDLGITTNSTCYALTHKRDSPCDSLEHPCPLAITHNTKEPAVVEHLHYSTTGEPINVEVHGYPILDEAGNVVQMIEYSIDITERKKAEVALQQAYDDLELRVDELGTLNLIIQTLATVTNVDMALQIVAGTMLQLLKAGGAIIGLLDNKQTSLTIAAQKLVTKETFNPIVRGKFVLPEQSILQQVITSKQSLIVPRSMFGRIIDLLYDPELAELIACLMLVPLLVRGRSIGIIILHAYHNEHGFNPADKKLAETVAGQVAGAIELANMFDEQQRINMALSVVNQRMQDELALAQEIQRGLLPPTEPNWPQFELVCYTLPAHEVGGDFYTYHALPSSPTDNERFAIAVGDVSGKGVSAALLMATSLSQFDAALLHPFSPVERLTYLDQAMMPYTRPRNQNCALAYVELELLPNSEFARLQLVNAGCIPPYIKRANGHIEHHEIGGFALGQGLATETSYDKVSLDLHQGDLVVLTSDGVVEATNLTGDMLGFGQLAQIVRDGPTSSASDLLAYIKEQLFTFTNQADQHDDMTIVVFQV
ncbi:PAS domain S-box protein [Anaerolineales bacterium HSG25]|nr:PAS domain S-box protein [Anaerolineales bacterium HSG25]